MSSYTDPKKEGRFSWINNFAFRGSNQSTNDETELPVLAPREQRSSSISTIQLGENGNDRRVSGAIQYLPQIHTNRSSPRNSIQSFQRDLSFRESSENSRDSSPKASGSRYMKPDTVINVQPESISPSYQFDNSYETSSQNATFYCSPLGEPSVIHGVMMSGVLLGAPVLRRFQEESPSAKFIPNTENSSSDDESAYTGSSQSSGLQKRAGHVAIEMPSDDEDEYDEQVIRESGGDEQTTGENGTESVKTSGYIPVTVGVVLGGVLLGAFGLREHEQRDVDSGQSETREEMEDDGVHEISGEVKVEGKGNKESGCIEYSKNIDEASGKMESVESIKAEPNPDDSSCKAGRDESLGEQSGNDVQREALSDQGASASVDGGQEEYVDVESTEDRQPNQVCSYQQSAGPLIIKESVLGGPAQSVKSYYDMMHYSGVNAHKPMQTTTTKNWASWILYYLQKVFFCYVVLTSAFQSICLTKTGVLQFTSENGDKRYNSLVYLGLQLGLLLIKICLTYRMSFKKEKTDRMIKAIVDYQQEYHYENDKDIGSREYSWVWKLVILLAIVTIVLSGMRAVFGTGANSSKELILQSSYEFSHNVFMWNPKNITAAEYDLERRYATNLTTTTVAFGLFVILRDASSYLQLGMAVDVVAIVCIVLYVFVKGFMKELKEVIPNVPKENVEAWDRLQKKREKLWRKYQMLQTVNGAVNDVYDPLVKVQHLGNLLMYAFFMTLIITQRAPWLALILCAVDLFKAEIAYLIAAAISEVNELIRDWIRNWAWGSGKIRVGDEEIDAAMILDELDRHPIGLGKGKFLIHKTFHYKFWGLVGSVFFSMADEEKN